MLERKYNHYFCEFYDPMPFEELIELMKDNGVFKDFENAVIEAKNNSENVIYVQCKKGFFQISSNDNEKFYVITFVPIRYILHVLLHTLRLNVEAYINNIIQKYW